MLNTLSALARGGAAASPGRMTTAELPLDSHPETQLDFALVQRALAEGYDRPLLLLDPAIVRAKARRFKAAMPRVRPHYAVKANPHPAVLRTLIEEGCGFEIASIAELDLLLSLGVPVEEIHYSNPVKSPAYLRYARDKGVQWYCIDGLEEMRKIVAIQPDARLYARLEVSNDGADWPLSGKFGVHPMEVEALLDEAVRIGARLAGITFHVGSQCRNAWNWAMGIEMVSRIFRDMRARGLEPELLNIGGGYPVRQTKPIPSIEVIGEVINAALADVAPSVRIMAEPGRFLVSDAGCFVCRVIGREVRNGKHWMYWDSGLFSGMAEAHEGLRLTVETDRRGPLLSWNIGGPSCDSIDIVYKDILLPADLQPDDFIYFRNAGAYTTSYASNFNGFPLPEVRIVRS